MRFQDRRQAGQALGDAVAAMEPPEPVVLALPRGGVPVGFEVAARLECDLDVLLVRKLGVPFHPELAMGAVAEGGVVVRSQEVMEMAGVREEEFERVLAEEREEVERRAATYRDVRDRIDPVGHTALVVDDGLATGSTALAAVESLRERGAGSVWVCVPVAPGDTARSFEQVADRLVVLQMPAYFGAVGAWYRDFAQTSDDEVRRLLADARLP